MQQMGNVETKYTTRFKYSKLHLSGLIGTARHPDMKKTRIYVCVCVCVSIVVQSVCVKSVSINVLILL